MKYIHTYNELILENVVDAKKLLSNLGIELTNPDYLKIREMIKGNDGYTYWFTKLRFIDKQPLNELENIWDIIKDKGLLSYFSKPVVELESVEAFWDEVDKAKTKSSVKKVINEFPSYQKSFFDLENEDDINLLKELSKSKSLTSLIKKISSFRDKKSFIEAADRLLKSQTDGTFEKIFNLVKETGAYIKHADESNDIIICRVNYDQIKVLGGDTSWCIVRSESTFNSYSSGGYQWIIFLTDKFDGDSRLSKIGLTTFFSYSTAHDKYDGHLSEKRISEILTSRDYDIKELFINFKDIMDKKILDDYPVELLLKIGFTKEQIIERKNIFKLRSRYLHRFQPTEEDLTFFNEDERTKYDLISRTQLNFKQMYDLTKKEILDKKCLQRLDEKPALSDLFKIFDKEEILNNNLIEYTYIDPISIFRGHHLSNFSKKELIDYKIIDKSNNLNIDQMIVAGFDKREITKYYGCLNLRSKSMIEFFKDKTKAQIIKRLSETFWSEDLENLSTGRKQLGSFKLDTMLFFDIDSDDIPLTSSVRNKIKMNSHFIDTLTVDKSSINNLHKLGYKITSDDNLKIILSLFGIPAITGSGVGYDYLNIDNLSKIIQISNLLKDEKELEIINTYINNILGYIGSKYMITLDYWSYLEVKRNIGELPIWSKIKEKIKNHFVSNLHNLQKFNIDYTISYCNEFGLTKEDYDKIDQVHEIAQELFGYSIHSYDIDKIFGYFESIGYNLTDDSKIDIITRVLDGVGRRYQYRDKPTDEKPEEFYLSLISNKLDVKNSYLKVIEYINSYNSLRDSRVIYYQELFKGSGFEDELEEALKFVKYKEYNYNIISTINRCFENDYSVIELQKWYDTYFNDYLKLTDSKTFEIPELSRKYMDSIEKVIILLTKINKIDEIDKMNVVDLMKRQPHSFGRNLLHTIIKVITRSSSEFRRIVLSDSELKSLYDWVIKHVDESKQSVKREMYVAYYLYDKKKYNDYVSSVMSTKSNLRYDNWNGVEKIETLRIHDLRFILSHFLSNGKYGKYEKLIDELLSYSNPDTPRALKMGKSELTKTLSSIGTISINGYTIDRLATKPSKNVYDFRREIHKKMVDKYTMKKESFILKWSEFYSK